MWGHQAQWSGARGCGLVVQECERDSTSSSVTRVSLQPQRAAVGVQGCGQCSPQGGAIAPVAITCSRVHHSVPQSLYSHSY